MAPGHDELLHSTALITFLGEVLVLLRPEFAFIVLMSMRRSGLNLNFTPLPFSRPHPFLFQVFRQIAIFECSRHFLGGANVAPS